MSFVVTSLQRRFLLLKIFARFKDSEFNSIEFNGIKNMSGAITFGARMKSQHLGYNSQCNQASTLRKPKISNYDVSVAS